MAYSLRDGLMKNSKLYLAIGALALSSGCSTLTYINYPPQNQLKPEDMPVTLHDRLQNMGDFVSSAGKDLRKLKKSTEKDLTNTFSFIPYQPEVSLDDWRFNLSWVHRF
jgi:hypothetical protein